ncbi:MAG: TRAP transporter small permease subunit [Caulobacterales bacterium]|jgi:TRAP-type mannitol/chloroaromatic compound transport system permease small subunit
MNPGAVADLLGPALSVMLGGLAGFLALPALILASGRFGAEIAAPVTQITELVNAGAERIAQALLALLALLIGITVVARYGFGVGSNLLQESALYAHALAFLLAAPAALGRDGHVRVDVFYARFSARGKALVNLGAFAVFAAPMLIAILHFSGPYVAASWRIGERSAEADGLPLLFVLKTAIPVFCVLLLAQALAQACRAACILRGLDPALTRFGPDEERPG